eukprot:scaffold2801_cov266-Pinguiococcus_pyrenoidosus.AAC.8
MPMGGRRRACGSRRFRCTTKDSEPQEHTASSRTTKAWTCSGMGIHLYIVGCCGCEGKLHKTRAARSNDSEDDP